MTGSVFAGYRIVRPLGESSARGDLYLATRLATARSCALRVLPAALVADPEGAARFEEVGSLRAGIDSGHVVDLIDAGVDKASGAPWFAMPFLKGKTLEKYADAPLSQDDTLEVLAQLAHALNAMNVVGCAHGTLDPERIVLLEDESYGSPFTLKVLDFWTEALLRERLRPYTPDDGALRWVAPELLDPDVTPTRAADVWSFGLLAFRLLTGVSYWQGVGAALRAEVTAAPLEDPSRRARALGLPDTLPDGFDAWFARCVARPIDERFADVDAAIDQLAPLLGGESITDDDAPAPAPRRAPAAPRGERLRSLPPWARSVDFMIPAVLVLVTLGALGVRQIVRARRSPANGRTAVTAPAAPAPTPGAAPAAPAFTVGNLDERATADLVRRLGAVPRGRPAWVAVTADDPEATARAEQLRAIFTRAGWEVRPLQRYAGRLRPGYFLFVADMEPPEYVTTLSTALRANRLIDDFFRGYRDYYRDRSAADPNFVGFPMAPDQTFILAVGRTPTP